MPYKVQIEGSPPIEVDDQMLKNTDFATIDDKHFHAIIDGLGYRIKLLKVNRKDKEMVLSINDEKCHIKLEDDLDQLLNSMGFSKRIKRRIDKIESPMPGLVLEVDLHPGQTVQQGDKLIILEAMKMENIIKSPVDGTIQEVLIKPGENIMKGQLLIRFENE